jgi:hypothetical protein
MAPKWPVGGATKPNQRATSTQYQEASQWQIRGAPKTQPKAQYWSIRGSQEPNNKMAPKWPVGVATKNNQRVTSTQQQENPQASGRGDKDPNQGPTLIHQRATSTQQQETPHWSVGGAPKTQPNAYQRATSTQQQEVPNGKWEGRQKPTRGPHAPTNKRRRNGK